MGTVSRFVWTASAPRASELTTTAPCHTVLSAQLLRLQYEVNVPLWDCLNSRIRLPIPYDDLLRTVKSVRRACLSALRDQCMRLAARNFTPFLPPPRFSVTFCPFALQLKKDQKRGNASFQTQKLRPHDRYDEREICPYCDAHISVTSHSGLPEHRRILFQSHTPQSLTKPSSGATFACSSCYKTFDDSYAFLDHVFQKEINSERSCLRRWSTRLSIRSSFIKSDPALVEKCLRNCLQREMSRSNLLQCRNLKSRDTVKAEVQVTIRPVDSQFSTRNSRR